MAYNADTLVNYMLVTGDFAEPETRLAFGDNELQRLDQICKHAGLQLASVYEAKQNYQQYAEAKVERDGVFGT